MTFKDDLVFSNAAVPLQDALYKKLFPIKHITRFPKEDRRHVLDVSYHIDVELELTNGIKLLGQEKVLRKKFAGFNTFTIEFYQDWRTRKKGEFFNLGAQFYTHGYVNGNEPNEITKFIKCYIIKIFDFLEWLKKKPIEELEKNTRMKGSREKNSFYYVNYSDIPERFIYYKEEI